MPTPINSAANGAINVLESAADHALELVTGGKDLAITAVEAPINVANATADELASEAAKLIARAAALLRSAAKIVP